MTYLDVTFKYYFSQVQCFYNKRKCKSALRKQNKKSQIYLDITRTGPNELR